MDTLIGKTKLTIKENTFPDELNITNSNGGFLFSYKFSVATNEKNEIAVVLNPLVEMQSNNKKIGHLMGQITYMFSYTNNDDLCRAVYKAIVESNLSFGKMAEDMFSPFGVKFPIQPNSYNDMKPKIENMLKGILK